jgi:hypothetical protein
MVLGQPIGLDRIVDERGVAAHHGAVALVGVHVL